MNDLLPGWMCSCGHFNGDVRERLAACRVCGAGRPPDAFTCASCAHWAGAATRTTSVRFMCMRIDAVDHNLSDGMKDEPALIVVGPGPVSFRTLGSFGCNQWKARRASP